MTVRRIRVLHLVNTLNYGGMERLVADMGRLTDPTRFETHIMALSYLGHFSAGLDQFATLHVASSMRRWSMLRPTTLAHDIRRIAPDVVHMHSGAWYKGSLASRMAGVPFQVYTDHGRQNPDPWINRTLDRMASRHTDTIVAVSEKLAEHLRGFVVDARRVRVVRNGVDTARYAPGTREAGALRHELGIAADRPIIGSVGRLEPVKGYEVTIAAFGKLLTTWTDTPLPALVLIGDGSQRKALEDAAAAANATPHVHFLGWRSDIEQCMADFTIFSMSSHSEGTSVSLLEAMSSGLCPVVTNVGGNAAVLGDALRHRLVEPANPSALAAAWIDALRDQHQRSADAGAARARVVDHFGLNAMVRHYEDIYASALPAA